LEILKESVELAKLENRTFDIVMTTQYYAEALGSVGRYKEAFFHTKIAMDTFHSGNLGAWQRYLELINNLCYFQILTSSTTGVIEKLEENQAMLSDANSSLVTLYTSTFGEYYLASGQPGKALPYFTWLLENSEARFAPFEALTVVATLIANRQEQKALNLAEEMYFSSKDSDTFTHHVAVLGYGMSLVLVKPEESIEYLEQCCDFFISSLSASYYNRAALFLAKAYLLLRDEVKANDVIARGEPFFTELSEAGFRLFSGPSDFFEDVWAKIRAKPPSVYIKCLGKTSLYVHGKELSIPLRWYEILVLLAAHPEGLSSEQLLVLLYGDNGNLITLKSTLSKMRHYVPLTSRIYKIDTEYGTDFLELEKCLERGDVKKALNIYHGSLLPQSDVPGIVEMRELLDERVRQAVLQSRSSTVFEQYSYTNQDDLETLEGWLQIMPKNHPSNALVRARIKLLAKQMSY
jgi:tetratricopeptide (TPR) repeat protein